MDETTTPTDSIEDILEEIRPAEATVDICVRGDLSVRLEELEAELDAALEYDANHNVSPPTAAAVVERMGALHEEMAGSVRKFRVVSIGATAWRAIVAEHPPPPDDLLGMRWDPTTFAPAALAVSCASPRMTHEQAVRLQEKLSDGQWEKLTRAMFSVNMGDDLPKFARGIAGRPTSAPSSTTADLEGSLTQGSSAPEASPAPESSSGPS